MTGTRDPGWTWLHRVAVPALWAVTDVTWVCLWVRALCNLRPGYPTQHLPFVAVAAPAALAAIATGYSARCRGSWIQRTVLLGPVVVIGIGLTGLVLSVFVYPGVAWSMACLAWARGAWLANREYTIAHAARSAGVGTLAFVTLIVVQRTTDLSGFDPTVWPSAGLFALFLCGSAVTMAMLRQRDLEKQVLAQPRSRPEASWLAVLGGPFAVVAVGALVVAVVLGPVAGPVVRGGAIAGRPISSAFDSGRRALKRAVPETQTPTAAPAQYREPETPTKRQGGLPGWVGVALIGLFFLFLLWGVVSAVAPGGLAGGGLGRGPTAGESLAEETRSSLFSWKHLWAALRAFFAKLFGRRRTATALAPGGRAGAGLSKLPSVRRQYRDVLLAARNRGVGRHAPETPLEFGERLGAYLQDLDAEHLRALTTSYDDVRYGERLVEEDDDQQADADAREVIRALTPAPTMGE